MTEADIHKLVSEDEEAIAALRAAQSLNLPDWWIGAGFLRNRVWDALSSSTEKHPGEDVDLIYFDPANIDEDQEKAYDSQLRLLLPGLSWSAKNEARMHIKNEDAPYTSSLDAVAHWPETATAVAMTLNEKGDIILAAPHGFEDLLTMTVRPTPSFMSKLPCYNERVTQKPWRQYWPELTVIIPD